MLRLNVFIGPEFHARCRGNSSLSLQCWPGPRRPRRVLQQAPSIRVVVLLCILKYALFPLFSIGIRNILNHAIFLKGSIMTMSEIIILSSDHMFQLFVK